MPEEKSGTRADFSVLAVGREMISRLNIGQLILIFALAALPFAATFAFYYPDERHYSDGALEMLKGRGWLIPKNADGTPRFEKPPLAYWAIAASCKFFGVNVMALRLPFLLASCGTLFLTFRLARKLTGNAETALLAAIILLSHPQFFLCSIRSLPDALLVFFITLSATGFLRLIAFEEFAASAFWAAYGGAAGAVLSKGLLGLLIVGFAWSFCILKNHDWRVLKKIIHPPIFIVAAILAASWFIYIFLKDGALAWRGLFGDQVSGNIHGHFWSPILRAPLFTLILFFNFLPWSVPAVEFLFRRKTLEPSPILPAAKNFMLGWTAILILGFALGANVSLRYLLPAAPLFAILIANALSRSEKFPLIFSVRRVLKITLVFLVLLDAAAFLILSQWPLPNFFAPAICLLFLAATVVLGFGAWREKFSAAAALGTAILTGCLILFVAVMPVLLPDRAQQIAAALEQAQIGSPKTVMLVGSVQLASRVRVCLGKSWTVTQADKLNPADAKKFNAVLLPEADGFLFANGGWKIQAAAAGFAVPPRSELWQALKSRQLPEIFSRHAQTIILVTRE
jgi:4-amino-4-deoxy-L-arabinose transferase-like glycosyltransferase